MSRVAKVPTRLLNSGAMQPRWRQRRLETARALAACERGLNNDFRRDVWSFFSRFVGCMMPGCEARYLKLGHMGSSCCALHQCICQTRYLEGTKATVCVCIGVVGRPPYVERFESCLKAVPGVIYLLPSLPSWRCCCVAISGRALWA